MLTYHVIWGNYYVKVMVMSVVTSYVVNQHHHTTQS